MARRGITITTSDMIATIEKTPRGLRATTRKGEAIEADQILFAIGRRPATKGFGLDAAGVALDAEGAIVVERVGVHENPNFGFNAQNDTYEDLVQSGVIDPTKVTRTALQNAASIASLMLTTEAMVADIPEKKAAPAGPGGHGGPGEMDY